MEFENRANFHGKWKLGTGMADVLTTRLLETDRFTVLERQNLDDVIGEIIRQGKQLFRDEGKVARGRLKNARYLVRGVITDFSVTGDVSGWFGTRGAKVSARSQRARVALNVRVSDVETGEIVASVTAEKSASSGWFGGSVDYRQLAFGGDAFFQTPLGHATEIAIAIAVRDIMRELPIEYWEPRVAEAGPDRVVVNGGENVRVREGDVFLVRESGRQITDPVTGNVIEDVPGNVVGRVEIREVNEMSAHGVLLEGTAARGQHLEWIESNR
jgi:curli biogenesis system outer membrane secretion channel CsgG